MTLEYNPFETETIGSCAITSPSARGRQILERPLNPKILSVRLTVAIKDSKGVCLRQSSVLRDPVQLFAATRSSYPGCPSATDPVLVGEPDCWGEVFSQVQNGGDLERKPTRKAPRNNMLVLNLLDIMRMPVDIAPELTPPLFRRL